MNHKTNVLVLLGGCSVEHEISLQSARNIVAALGELRYNVIPVGIDKRDQWYLCDQKDFVLHADDPRRIRLATGGPRVALVRENRCPVLIETATARRVTRVDVVFPVLHGTHGEDGTIQGLLELVGTPYVGSGVAASAIGMDKDITKRLLRQAGIPIADFVAIRSSDSPRPTFEQIARRLGVPFFVKPASLGSSVGVSKVHSRREFRAAVDEAFAYDAKIIVEEYIEGREIECSVLGNEHPIASVPGEVVPHHEFYSYEAKYLDEKGASLVVPADLPPRVVRQVRAIAVRAFQVLCCEGMARVDMFLRNDSALFVNELNTIPGFTRISMYPKLWEASGMSCCELVQRLVELALVRHRNKMKLRRSVRPDQFATRGIRRHHTKP